MTKEEFLDKQQLLEMEKDALVKRLNENRHEHEALCKAYQNEVLERSGYHIGQKVTDKDGLTWFVSGTFIMSQDVYLVFNFAKKDGTMSKVSGMGRAMPLIKIA